MPNTSPSTDGADSTWKSDDPVRRAAVAAFKRAASGSHGYRDWLAGQGVDPGRIGDIHDVPYLVKQDVFGGDVGPWLVGGRLSDAAELLTSSGRGGMFSIGVSSRADLAAGEVTTDAALRAFGASEDSPTLLLNCLPMGINVPTTLATVATPSVHLEMAQEIYERLGPGFDRIIVLAEPLFLKEFGEQLSESHGGPWLAAPTICVVGGEWVSESWRTHVGRLLGPTDSPSTGAAVVLVSMGAAELGLNLLFETGELYALRSVLARTDHGAALLGRPVDYTPSLFAFDPERMLIEERSHADGSTTLAFTTLDDRLLPLIRYDLGDLAEFVPADRVAAALDGIGIPAVSDQPIVAFWGRRSDGVDLDGASVRPEQIKEQLFSDSAVAAAVTGRFSVQGGAEPVLHLQLRKGMESPRELVSAFVQPLTESTGAHFTVSVHAYDRYPFHEAGDFQHKPVYKVVG